MHSTRVRAAVLLLLFALCTSPAFSKESKIPMLGEKLWGVWRVVEYSIPEKSLLPQDVDALRENRLYLAVRQIVEIADDGIYYSRRSLQAGHPKNLPHVRVSLKSPPSNDLCKRELWSPYCINGKLIENFEFREILPVVAEIKNFAYPKCSPDASNVEYGLFDVNTGYFAIFARTIGSKRLCVGLRRGIEYRDASGILRKDQVVYGMWERIE